MIHVSALSKECPKGKGKELKVDAIKGPYVDVQSAIDAAQPGDKIKIEKGNYPGFIVDEKSCLEIEGVDGQTIIAGSLLPQMDEARGPWTATIFVKNSDNIDLKHLTVIGGLTDDVGVWYGSSSGTIEKCDIAATANKPGAPSPASAVVILGQTRPSDVTVKHSKIHDFGKCGILVHSAAVPGTRGKIEHNEITGRVFTAKGRVQDGLQINWGAYANIKNNKISDCNNTATPPSWSSDAILVSEGIVDAEHNDITNCYEGIYVYAYGWYAIPILNSKHDKIEFSTDCGLILEGTDTNTYIEDAKIKNNTYGLYQFNYGYAVDPVVAVFKDCDLKHNVQFDVIQDPYMGSVILDFYKVKYDTYYEVPGGLGTVTLNTYKK